MQFVLPLMPADNGSSRRMTTLHVMLALVLCGIGAGSLALYWFTAISPNFKKPYAPFVLLGVASLLLGLGIIAAAIFYKSWLRAGKRSLGLRIIEIVMMGGASGTFAFAGQTRPAWLFALIAAAILLAALWEMRKPAAAHAVMDEKGIRLPKGGIMRLIPWSEVDKVLVRHGILSIELSGNRLLQRNLAAGSRPDAAAIEAYCGEQAAAAAVTRSADW
jgi:hypothetical protein